MKALPAKHQKASQKCWKLPGRTGRTGYPGSCGGKPGRENFLPVMESDCSPLPSYMESAFPSPPSRTDDVTTAKIFSEAVQDIQTTAHAVALARASHKTYVKAEGTLTVRDSTIPCLSNRKK